MAEKTGQGQCPVVHWEIHRRAYTGRNVGPRILLGSGASQFSGKHLANAAPGIICYNLTITLCFFVEETVGRIGIDHQLMSDMDSPQF
jgi:hypothetical protein